MSGPGGTSTKRDQRREARRSQLQKRQQENRRRREAQIRRQRIQRGAIWGGSLLVLVIVVGLIAHAVIGSGGGSTSGSSNTPHIITGTGTYTTPVNGDPRDGMTCLTTEGSVIHIHAYLEIFANGQPVQVPPNTGIVQNQGCLYAMHVHDGEPNIIHIESPVQATYTLGAFFDIWGQPLSASQMMNYKADASHPLTFEVFDANGKLTKYTGNPLDLQVKAHDTIVILYNSPNVQPTPFTQWNGL